MGCSRPGPGWLEAARLHLWFNTFFGEDPKKKVFLLSLSELLVYFVPCVEYPSASLASIFDVRLEGV